jgi:hypothetical protein
MHFIKHLWKYFLYPSFASIGIYACVAWYWNNYIYGIRTNEFKEDISIILKNDTLYNFKQLEPGSMKLIFKDHQLEVTHKDSLNRAVHSSINYPKDASLHIKTYKADNVVSFVLN